MNISMSDLIKIIKDETRGVLDDFHLIQDVDSLEEKRKPQCIKGNPFHGKDGEFVKPEEDSGSWSIGKGGKSGSDCDWGQSKRPNRNRKEVWTKTPCGRSGKYKCKDGTVKEDYVLGPSGEIMKPDLRNISESDLIDELWRRMDEGNINMDYLMSLCSKVNQASSGNFPPKKK